MCKGKRRLRKSVKIFIFELVINSMLLYLLFSYYNLMFAEWKLSLSVTIISVGSGIIFLTTHDMIKTGVKWFAENKIVVEPMKVYIMEK